MACVRVRFIVGIAQEAVWFDGEAGGDWNDPDGHDLHTEAILTDYYLEYLARYQEAGLPVFNCEYAVHHAAEAYAKSDGLGFVPYVSRTSLAQLTTTPPPSY